MAETREQDSPGMAAIAGIAAAVAVEGSASHPHRAALADLSAPDALRAAADFVHQLTALHARLPGLLDHVLACAGPDAPGWLAPAADAFAAERALMVRLASAVGPPPSTPGQRETETALQQQRHAIDLLARSERRGCGLGAAMALILEWTAIRWQFDRIALRLGEEAPRPALPTAAAFDATAPGLTMASARAARFGAEQLLAQHRGLWTLLDARHHARIAASHNRTVIAA